MRVLFALLVLLACAGLAEAGSKDQPELADGGGDVVVYPEAPGAGPLADAVDLRAVWFEQETATTVDVVFLLTDLSSTTRTGNDPFHSIQYAFRFDVSSSDHVFEARADDSGVVYSGSPTGAWRHQVYDETDGNWTVVDGQTDESHSTIRVTLPKLLIGAPEPGDVARNFTAQAWSSEAYGDPQWDDWAEAPASTFQFKVGLTAPAAAGNGSAPSAGGTSSPAHSSTSSSSASAAGTPAPGGTSNGPKAPANERGKQASASAWTTVALGLAAVALARRRAT